MNLLRRSSVTALLVVLMTGSSASPSLAAGAVPVPLGFKLMCEDHPAECRGRGPSQIAYTAELKALLESVNRQVNARIKPVAKEVIDVWSVNATQGDCEEYVLAKRRALISAGIPPSAMSIVYALKNGGGHALLAVHTDHGSLALDNLSKRVRALDSTGYRLVSMSGPNPKVWKRVGPTMIASQ